MHSHDASTEVLTQAVLRYAVDRIRLDPPPLDGPRTAAELRAMAGRTITPRGVGGLEALRVFSDVLAQATTATPDNRTTPHSGRSARISTLPMAKKTASQAMPGNSSR